MEKPHYCCEYQPSILGAKFLQLVDLVWRGAMVSGTKSC